LHACNRVVIFTCYSTRQLEEIPDGKDQEIMTHILRRAIQLLPSALLITLLWTFSFAAAAEAPGLAGKWKMASVTPDGSTIDWTLTMKHDGDTWTATVGGVDADAPAKDIKVDGASLHMKTPYGGEYYDIDLKLDGDKLTGKWSGNSDSGATTGTRVADPAAK
jgi:hypothetical protein